MDWGEALALGSHREQIREDGYPVSREGNLLGDVKWRRLGWYGGWESKDHNDVSCT